MKLERTHEYLVPVFVILSALALAILAGLSIGTGQTRFAYAVVGIIIVTTFFLSIRQKVWMLIPATWMLGGKISLLPLPATVAQLGILFAFGTFLLLKAFKVIRLKPKISLVDVWMLVMLGYLLTVYIRNPVGVDALGSDRVGGKPYFDVVVAFCGYWVLARAVATPSESYLVPLMGVAGHWVHAWLNALAYRLPFLAQPLGQLYSGITAAENPDVVASMEGNSRQAHLQGIGFTLFSYAAYRWKPFTIINPFFWGRFLVFLVASGLILLSGFRSSFIIALLVFLAATYFRSGLMAIIRAVVVLSLVLALLIGVQGNLINLPAPAQRALSFLPGNWDYQVLGDAQGSTEWRVAMWIQMLTTDKYIENKWLGDGFGFTRHQLQVMAANSRTGTNADQQENLMISGGVHSGPVSTIRFVGYVGLALFLILILLTALRGWRLIRRAEDTPYFMFALYAGIPLVLLPFTFILVFGAFEGDLPNLMVAIGMQKLLENSLDAYETAEKGPAAPEAEVVPQFVRPPEHIAAARIG